MVFKQQHMTKASIQHVKELLQEIARIANH